jgi:hypothetical protein
VKGEKNQVLKAPKTGILLRSNIAGRDHECNPVRRPHERLIVPRPDGFSGTKAGDDTRDIPRRG